MRIASPSSNCPWPCVFSTPTPASSKNFSRSIRLVATVKIYTCGPTVYSHAHIGNFRAYIFEDLLQRHLELRGYKVHRVMNLTDVDDKTIRGAREAGVPLAEFTSRLNKRSSRTWTRLRIKRGRLHIQPPPTQRISRR